MHAKAQWPNMARLTPQTSVSPGEIWPNFRQLPPKGTMALLRAAVLTLLLVALSRVAFAGKTFYQERWIEAERERERERTKGDVNRGLLLTSFSFTFSPSLLLSLSLYLFSAISTAHCFNRSGSDASAVCSRGIVIGLVVQEVW